MYFLYASKVGMMRIGLVIDCLNLKTGLPSDHYDAAEGGVI
jgi:hypothetical protein